jgi:spore germination protein YaaH
MKRMILVTLLVGAALLHFADFPDTGRSGAQSIFSPLTENTWGTPKNNLSPGKEVWGFLPFWMLENHKYFQYDKLDYIYYFGLHIQEDGNFLKIKEDGTSELGWLNWRKSETLNKVIADAEQKGTTVGLTVISQDNNVMEAFFNCPSCQQRLLEETIAELRAKELRVVNFDFEYSGIAPDSVRDGYTAFIANASSQIKAAIPNSRITVSTFANSAFRTRIHDIKGLAPSVDKIFVMAYDFHQLADDQTGPIAPISGFPDKFRYDLTRMVEDYSRFSEPEKLILGVAYYGHHWITNSESIGSLRIPGNDAIGYSRIEYYEECEYHDENTQSQKMWDSDAQTPWFYYFDDEAQVYRQCHYENVQSLEAKYNFAIDNNLGGVGIWSLGYDGDRHELWNLLEKKFFQ